MRYTLGSLLHPDDRALVLGTYVYRFTRDHIPEWAKRPLPDGRPTPMQFASDDDWLANTTFAVKRDGRLDNRVKACTSYPTWPDGLPEGITRRGIGEHYAAGDV